MNSRFRPWNSDEALYAWLVLRPEEDLPSPDEYEDEDDRVDMDVIQEMMESYWDEEAKRNANS